MYSTLLNIEILRASKKAATRAGLPLGAEPCRWLCCGSSMSAKEMVWFVCSPECSSSMGTHPNGSKYAVPSTLTCHAEAPYTLAVADAIHVNISQSEEQELLVLPQMLEMMKDPQFLPPWMKQVHTREETWEYRVVKPQWNFQGIMSAYGNQHEISTDLLTKNGLHAFVVVPDPTLPEKFRLASPWEFASAMGLGTNIVLPGVITLAWKMVGKCIGTMPSTNGMFTLSSFVWFTDPIPSAFRLSCQVCPTNEEVCH